MIKRWLLRWLMPDAISALRLLQERFGMHVGISWSPSANVSVVHGINRDASSIPSFKLDVNAITNHRDSTGLIREINRRQMGGHLVPRHRA